MLRSSGTPVALSTGVPLFTKTQRLPGCEVHTRSYDKGGFDHHILMPGLGPGVNGWATSRYHPSGHPLTAEKLDKIDRGFPVDFSALTTPEVFFTRDKKGEFVLMDAWTRKLVQVSPLNENLKSGFWSGIMESYQNVVNGRWVPPAGPDSWMPPGGTDPLFKGEVWVCMNPAPFHKDHPVAWSFDGARAVLFDPTPRPPDPTPGEVLTPERLAELSRPWTPEQLRCSEEKLFGLMPYEV